MPFREALLANMYGPRIEYANLCGDDFDARLISDWSVARKRAKEFIDTPDDDILFKYKVKSMKQLRPH